MAKTQFCIICWHCSVHNVARRYCHFVSIINIDKNNSHGKARRYCIEATKWVNWTLCISSRRYLFVGRNWRMAQSGSKRGSKARASALYRTCALNSQSLRRAPLYVPAACAALLTSHLVPASACQEYYLLTAPVPWFGAVMWIAAQRTFDYKTISHKFQDPRFNFHESGSSIISCGAPEQRGRC